MKILHVITSLRTGGAEKLMVDILPRQKSKGNEVDLAVFDGYRTAFTDQLEAAGINIIKFNKEGGIYNPQNIFKLWKLFPKYDIVHTHLSSPQFFAALASVLCSVVLVTTEHNTSNRRRRWKWYACVDKWMYRKYRHVICISEATEKNLRDLIGDGVTELSTIYNGIDVEKFLKATPLNRSELTPSANKKIVVMVAAFRYQKDQKTLIRAVKRLPEEYELWLVGGGELKEEIETFIEDQEMSNRVRMIGIRPDVPSVLKTADIVVQSSHIEGFGLAAVEGMAAGRPLLASNVEGLAQVVEGAGVLFEHENDSQLAAEIARICEDKKLYDALATRGIERAKLYDINKMVDAYLAIYSKVLNK